MNFRWPLSIIIISAVLLSIMLIRGVEIFDDTLFYLSAMKDIQGQAPIYEASEYTHQVIPMLNNPATLYLSVILGKLFGSELFGLSLLNALFYLATILVFYNICLLIFKSENQSIISTIFLAANYSILRFGPGAYLVDMAGWFFYIFSVYLALLFFNLKEDKWAYLAALTSAVGLFFKEYGGIGILSLGVFILLSNKTWSYKFILILKCGSFFLINLGYHTWSYIEYGYLYFNRYETVINDFLPNQSTFRTMKVLGYLFNLGWPLALIGFIKGLNNKILAITEYKKLFLGLLPPAIVFLAYPSYDQRIAFVAVPLLSILATLGIDTQSRKITYAILALYLCCNFFLIHKLSVPDTNFTNN